MTPTLVQAFSKALYSRLKEDPFLQKNIAGIFTHAPNSIQGSYLVYSIDPLKLLTPVPRPSSAAEVPLFENRAVGYFSVTGISEEGNHIVTLMHRINVLLDGQNLPLKDDNTLLGYVLCRFVRNKMNENITQRKRYLTVAFENFVRF